MAIERHARKHRAPKRFERTPSPPVTTIRPETPPRVSSPLFLEEVQLYDETAAITNTDEFLGTILMAKKFGPSAYHFLIQWASYPTCDWSWIPMTSLDSGGQMKLDFLNHAPEVTENEKVTFCCRLQVSSTRRLFPLTSGPLHSATRFLNLLSSLFFPSYLFNVLIEIGSNFAYHEDPQSRLKHWRRTKCRIGR